MKLLLAIGIIFISGSSLAEIMPQGNAGYKCQATGGFFDFSPAGAIASCKQEIDEYCKTKNSPPILGKVTGEPSGYGIYARAEISFQCASKDDLVRRQEAATEDHRQQVKLDVDSSKTTCQEDFGFNPGTPEFGNCLLELQKQIFSNRRAEQDRAAKNDIAEAQITQQRRDNSERAATSAIQSIQIMTAPRSAAKTNCTTYGNNTNCITR